MGQEVTHVGADFGLKQFETMPK